MEQIEPQFDVIDAGNGRFIKAWKRGVLFREHGSDAVRASDFTGTSITSSRHASAVQFTQSRFRIN
jgi:hypothetical protein